MGYTETADQPTDPAMQIRIRQTSACTIIELSGRLDTTTAPDVFRRCEAEVVSLPLLMDCGEIEYVSSAGLRSFLQLAKLVQKKIGSSLTLCRVGGMLAELLVISGLDRVFRVIPGPDDF